MYRSIDVSVSRPGRPEIVTRYAVNREYEGLFERDSQTLDWQQIEGCGQFRATTPRALMRGIVRSLYVQPDRAGTVKDHGHRMVRGSARNW